MMPGQHTEQAFETAIEYHLTTVGGYGRGQVRLGGTDQWGAA